MSAVGETPPPAPSSLAGQDAAQQPPSAADEFVVHANVVGAALRCVVDPKGRCEALLGAAAEAYRASFPHSEVPECNVIFHRKKQEFLVAGVAIGECCANGDELELGVTLPASTDAHSEPTPSIAPSSVSGRDSDGETSEFSVLFHKLPLGFTMKRGHGSSTEVGAIYPRSAATHFPRLAPGVAIVSIAGSSLKDLGLRQVHELIKNAALPLEIRFRGPEVLASPTFAPDAAEQGNQVPSSHLPGGLDTAQQERRRRGSADRRSVRSNGSNGSGRSRNSRGSGRGRSKETSPQQQNDDNQRSGEHGRKQAVQNESKDSNQQRGPESHDADHTAEAELVSHIEQLKVALLRKHEEAKQIARQLELCTEKLVSMRAGNGSVPPRHQQQHQQSRQNAQPARPRRTTSGESKVRLTPEVLEAMDQKAGLPRRGTGAYTSSNVSSISGYSGRSTPAPRSSGIRTQRSAHAALANADNMSVSSYTSQSSNTSGRGGGNRSPRGTALRNLNKRYNYMPQKYAANSAGASDAASTSLSSRGAVMSRARFSRDSFITKSESPGVGYYDVKVKDRVKGGEIGDSDRSLPWS